MTPEDQKSALITRGLGGKKNISDVDCCATRLRCTVFKPELAPKIASLMATVGFYEHTGDWLFTTGLPAKTGVGGGIMGVVPGVMGVAAFAPPLDGAGNSVKAQKALAFIAGHLNLNVFGTTRCVMAGKEPVKA